MYPNTTGGFQCAECGTFVAAGMPHTCPTRNNYPYPQPMYYGQGYGYIDNTILERIAKALEELIELKKKGL